MPIIQGESARYSVRFSMRGRIDQVTRTVSLTTGYTTFGDIPKILSMSMGVDVDDIVITELHSLVVE